MTLKPCPNCYATNPVVFKQRNLWGVRCLACKGEVHGFTFQEQAAELWNRLDSPAESRKRIDELEAMINYLANLRSAYWHRLTNGHGWRLIETDCGAMRLLAEADTPVECVQKAMIEGIKQC